MGNLSQYIDEVFSELTDGTDAGTNTVWFEEYFKEAVTATFKSGSPYLLNHINALYLFDNNGVRELIIYSDDSTTRASFDNRQGILKIFLAKRGITYDSLRILPSKHNMKDKHPFHETVETRPVAQPTRKVTPEELEEIDCLVQDIEDKNLRESIREAFLSDLRTSF